MTPCHICPIYGIWGSKEVGGCFKVINHLGSQCKAQGEEVGRGGILTGKWWFPLCNTAVLNLYCKSYWVL